MWEGHVTAARVEALTMVQCTHYAWWCMVSTAVWRALREAGQREAAEQAVDAWFGWSAKEEG